ncbi:hypothetical protein PybrP1_012332 [[Pythium] brassicae (nom. inval.)]|nr:hypothetical protein PybrP1_012332 [[Pythium] brassicae (nom. inval.)]
MAILDSKVNLNRLSQSEDEDDAKAADCVLFARHPLNMTRSLHVTFKGANHELLLPLGADTTVAQAQQLICEALGVPPDAQRWLQRKKKVDIANRHVVSIAKRNDAAMARDAVATDYRFHAIEELPTFADKDKAREILERLANDRGILAVMNKHKWTVGTLAEMHPDGKVGVDPVCVLGLNQNKGQKILLRLRTDDLLGFRKYLSIKKVLFHELTHNVHSEHDSKFYQLMRQVEKECGELDWANAGGAVVGGPAVAVIDDDEDDDVSGSFGRRLGGGSSSSRLLLPSGRSESVGSVGLSTSSTPAPPAARGEAEIDDKDEAKPHANAPLLPAPVLTATAAASATAAPIEPTAVADTDMETPLVSPRETDEKATSPPAVSSPPQADDGDREQRILVAIRQLRARHSAERVARAGSLLHKILSNVVAHPAEDKFRSIRKANRLFEAHVAQFPECLEFLRAVGFEDQAEKLVLVRQDPGLLWVGRSSLEQMLLSPPIQ